MTAIKWQIPTLNDICEIHKINQDTKCIASDVSAANIYFLRVKHNIKIAWINNLLVREYCPTDKLTYVNGVTFTLENANSELLKRTVDIIIQDRIQRELPVNFCFLCDQQKTFLENHRDGFVFECHRGMSDYLYSAEHLAYLRGRSNHKKKNRFLKFSKTYPNFEVQTFEQYGSLEMIEIAKKWLNTHTHIDDAKILEFSSIEEAIQNWNILKLIGIVIKVNNVAVAMSIASKLSDGVYDIHFEKSFGEYALNGAYVAVNMLFAKWLFEEKGAKWINREEDVDDPGLREAKSSYHPDLLLHKYVGKLNF